MATRMEVELKTLFLEKLKSSGLDGKAGDKLRLRPVTADQSPKQIPHKECGFIIPYFDLSGKVTSFWRWRYLKQPKVSGFAGMTNRKPLRYVQPPGTENELYLPPLIDWQAIATDPTFAVMITEGELKSAATTLITEYPCIGLGGVWSWRSAKRHLPALPMFEKFKWEGRPVYIIYDSDAVTNPMVMQAENALAKALTSWGAEPYIVRIPPMSDGSKAGIDDYLLDHTTEEFEELLEELEPWKAAQELHKLNEEVVYVRDPGLIMRVESLQKMAPRAFVDHAFSTRVFYEEQVTAKSTKLIPKSAPAEWIKWPARAEVERICYEPGGERITSNRELNVWPGWGVEPQKGDVSLWNQLLDHLFGRNKAAREWFEKWCAYPLQDPGVKMFSSALIWGLKHGTGKSLIGYSLFKIYGRNATEIKEENLKSTHNEWAENKQFVMGDEITGGDKRSTSDSMKGMITQQFLRLNPKYIPAYTVRDCINYYFTSNHPDSFFLEDNDRRYFIHEVEAGPLPDDFYRRYEAWIGKPGVTGPGAAALFHHLLHLDTTGFDPRAHALMTQAKADMMMTGMSDLGAWVKLIKESPDTALRIDSAIIKWRLWRSEDLLLVYDPDKRGRVTANGMARELSRQGFKKVANGNGVMTKSVGQVRLWAIRDNDELMNLSPTLLGQLYDKERGFVAKAKGASSEEKQVETVQRISGARRTSSKLR